jgi:hypothetical protein
MFGSFIVSNIACNLSHIGSPGATKIQTFHAEDLAKRA